MGLARRIGRLPGFSQLGLIFESIGGGVPSNAMPSRSGGYVLSRSGGYVLSRS